MMQSISDHPWAFLGMIVVLVLLQIGARLRLRRDRRLRRRALADRRQAVRPQADRRWQPRPQSK